MLNEIGAFDYSKAGYGSTMLGSVSNLSDLVSDHTKNGAAHPAVYPEVSSETDTNGVQITVPLEPKLNEWPVHYTEKYPGTFMYHFNLTLVRQYKLTARDTVFIKSRIGQCVIVGAIAGSLFSNLGLTDLTTRAGFLFYVVLFNAFSSFAMIPLCYDQKVTYLCLLNVLCSIYYTLSLSVLL